MSGSATGPGALDALWARLAGDPSAVAEALGGAGDDALPEAARMLRGLARLDSGDAAGACADFDAVLARDGQNAPARLHRALARFALGDAAGAAADLDGGPLFPHREWLGRFLRLFWPMQFDRPAIHRAAWDAESPGAAGPEARLAARLAAGTGPLSPGERRAMARQLPDLFLKDRWGEAWAAVEAALGRDPADSEARAFAAFFQLNRGEWQAAAEFLDPAVEEALARFLETREEFDLPSPDLLVEYAWRLHQEGRHHEALAVLATVRPAGPDDYQAHILAAMCWTTLGRRAEADAALAACLDDYFLDSWDLVVRPFIRKVAAWLRAGAPG